MQEFARGGHFFWDFTGWKWGFSGCPAPGTGELLPECGLWEGSGRFKIKEIMKHMKYLNIVLTVIAINLVLITLAVTGLFPTASAKEIGPRYVAVPVNADGTVNVNLSQVRGEDIGYRPLPIDVTKVDGRTIRKNPLPVVVGK